MADIFKIRIFTPAGLEFEDSARDVKLPTSDGEIGILPEHIQYTGLLGTGILEFTALSSGSSAKRLVISGGFCSFSNNTLTILADMVDMPDKVDRETYSKGRGQYQKTIEQGNTRDPEFDYAKQQLARIEAIDTLVSH